MFDAVQVIDAPTARRVAVGPLGGAKTQPRALHVREIAVATSVSVAARARTIGAMDHQEASPWATFSPPGLTAHHRERRGVSRRLGAFGEWCQTPASDGGLPPKRIRALAGQAQWHMPRRDGAAAGGDGVGGGAVVVRW